MKKIIMKLKCRLFGHNIIAVRSVKGKVILSCGDCGEKFNEKYL